MRLARLGGLDQGRSSDIEIELADFDGHHREPPHSPTAGLLRSTEYAGSRDGERHAQSDSSDSSFYCTESLGLIHSINMLDYLLCNSGPRFDERLRRRKGPESTSDLEPSANGAESSGEPLAGTRNRLKPLSAKLP